MPTLQEIWAEVLPPIHKLVAEHKRMLEEMENPALLPIVYGEISQYSLARIVLQKELRRGSIANCRNAYVRIRGRQKGAA